MEKKLTILFRQYCGLCHQMLAQLQSLQQELDFSIEIVDVDDDDDLVEKYDELVPVLLAGEIEICHWHLDEQALRAYFMQIR